MRTFAKIAAVQAIIFLCGLVVIELALRLFFPLPPHGGIYHDRHGAAVHVALDEDTLRPNLDIVHSASEFSAAIHTDEFGYRRMSNESLTPDYLFLGDSFTFGHGVSDDQVFSEIFCKARGATCLNLGRSGTDTFDQVRILRRAIALHQLRPKTVVVAMLSACWLGVAGNDLGDNLTHRQSELEKSASPQTQPSAPPPVPGLSVGRALRAVEQSAVGFEITKRALLVMAGSLKSSVYRCSSERELDAAADTTRIALDDLVRLSGKRDFKIVLFAIHPYQELGGAFRATEAVVGRAAPEAIACFGTGAQFRKEHYYPYDGHFNASGHANLASIIDRAIGRSGIGEPASACRG